MDSNPRSPAWTRWPRLRDSAFAVTLLLVPFWCVGQIARDAWRLTELCFYIPSAFLAVSLSGFALLHVAAKRRRVAILTTLLALPSIGFVLFVENHFAAPRPATTSGELRLVHWNVGGVLGRPGACDILVAQRADLYVLSEIPDDQSVQSLRALLGEEYQAQVFGNLAVVGRGTVQAEGWLLDRDRARVQLVTWRPAGHTVSLFVVDLPSSPFVARAPLLEELGGLIERRQPDLVVGDFNAPRRARGLSTLPAGYEHAYHSAGSGLGYTWPVPVPMYALDHCLHAGRILPARYALVTSIHSDHRCQVFDFALAPVANDAIQRCKYQPAARSNT